MLRALEAMQGRDKNVLELLARASERGLDHLAAVSAAWVLALLQSST
jgi:hypothetical protein